MPEEQQIKLEERLHNWGRWLRAGGGGAGPRECGSVESRYVAPRDDDGTRADLISREAIDQYDAPLIEAGVCGLRIERARQLLRREYELRKDKLSQAHWLDVSPMLVRPAILMAIGALQACLDRRGALNVRESRRMQRGLQPGATSSRVNVLPNVSSPTPRRGVGS